MESKISRAIVCPTVCGPWFVSRVKIVTEEVLPTRHILCSNCHVFLVTLRPDSRDKNSSGYGTGTGEVSRCWTHPGPNGAGTSGTVKISKFLHFSYLPFQAFA